MKEVVYQDAIRQAENKLSNKLNLDFIESTMKRKMSKEDIRIMIKNRVKSYFESIKCNFDNKLYNKVIKIKRC